MAATRENREKRIQRENEGPYQRHNHVHPDEWRRIPKLARRLFARILHREWKPGKQRRPCDYGIDAPRRDNSIIAEQVVPGSDYCEQRQREEAQRGTVDYLDCANTILTRHQSNHNGEPGAYGGRRMTRENQDAV